jgi:hypothetical protein
MTESRDPVNAPPQNGEMQTHAIHLPAPTAWPFLLALGITLLFASLVTNAAIGALGLLLATISGIGWFRDVLPHEAHEHVEATERFVVLFTASEKVARIQVDATHRAQLPLETFPVSSEIKGGIAGGIAMVIPAEIYEIVRFHSIWYVVNLLGGAGVGNWVNPTVEEMRHFHLAAFITTNIIQGSTTLLVGLLYGAMLPIWPKCPILLGGIKAPVIWTGPSVQHTRHREPIPGATNRLVVVRGIASRFRTRRRLHRDEAGENQPAGASAALCTTRCRDSGPACR